MRVEPVFSFQQLYIRGKSQAPSTCVFSEQSQISDLHVLHSMVIFSALERERALSCLALSSHLPLLVTVLLYGGLQAAIVFSLRECFALLKDLKVELRIRYNLGVLIHEILWAWPLRNKYI